jgi:hypothetical protein
MTEPESPKDPFNALGPFIAFLEDLPEEKKSKIVLHILLLQHLHFLHSQLKAAENDNTHMALVTRQLLELLITVEYVRRSEENALTFINSYHKDALDLDDSMIRLQIQLAKRSDKPIDFTEDKLRIDACRARIAAEKHPHKVFSVSRVAKDVGLDGDYDTLHKVCSKLLHCTPFLVIRSESKTITDNAAFGRMLKLGALHYANRVGEILVREINMLAGVAPPA